MTRDKIMGIFEFLKKKTDTANEMDFAIKSDKKVEEKEEFVADISMLELEKEDWSKFGSLLKQNKILPNSYVKKPVSVEVTLDKQARPMVTLQFNSSTSNSVRKYMLLQDGAYEIINDAGDIGRNELLNVVWEDFQDKIRYYNMIETNRAGFAHARKGVRLLAEAEKMINMKDIYEREQEFLEKYKNVQFDEFCYSAIFEKDNTGFINYAGELPQFIPLKETEDGYCISGEPVIPFTPRTLEHCILHMTNGQKVEDGEYLVEFEKKCRKLQKYSCFDSEDWDKVIAFGKDIVRNQCIVAMLSQEKEM